MTMDQRSGPTPREAAQQWREDLQEEQALHWTNGIAENLSDFDWITILTEATEPVLGTMTPRFDELDESLLTEDDEEDEGDEEEDEENIDQATLTYSCAVSTAAACHAWLTRYLGPELRHSTTPTFSSMSFTPEKDIAEWTRLRSQPMPPAPKIPGPGLGRWMNLRMARILPAKEDTDDRWTEAAKGSLHGISSTMHRITIGNLILKQNQGEPMDPLVIAHAKIQGRENIYSAVVYLASTMQAWGTRAAELYGAHLPTIDT